MSRGLFISYSLWSRCWPSVWTTGHKQLSLDLPRQRAGQRAHFDRRHATNNQVRVLAGLCSPSQSSHSRSRWPFQRVRSFGTGRCISEVSKFEEGLPSETSQGTWDSKLWWGATDETLQRVQAHLQTRKVRRYCRLVLDISTKNCSTNWFVSDPYLGLYNLKWTD